ncbi:MAG TPA: HepT-like ribonuclease domain-containing protein, partial [Pseudonocardiaceae bacterium]|nr:HepT-like ribonuclease domain-containing protein [Pseudonocardiaceae bacterium]
MFASEPDIPWADVAGMRDHLAHRYFDTVHSIVQATVIHDLPPLVAAVERLVEGRPPATSQLT